MCSPNVMQFVHHRVNSSRRNFLKAGGLAIAGAAAASVLRPKPVQARQTFSEVIDLSHVLGPATPMYGATDPVPTAQTVVTVQNDGFYIQAWQFGEHSGTHLDAPAHFVDGAETIDIYDPSKFIAPLVVIDVSAQAAENPDYAVTPDDLAAWEEANGEIPAGAFVAMYSGWDAKWGDIEAYRNADTSGVMHFPSFGIDALMMMLEERDIVGIGVDTLSIDIGASTTFDVHVTNLSAGKYGVENLAGLGALIGKSATVMVGIPRYENGSGGPCRVLAMA